MEPKNPEHAGQLHMVWKVKLSEKQCMEILAEAPPPPRLPPAQGTLKRCYLQNTATGSLRPCLRNMGPAHCFPCLAFTRLLDQKV